MPSVRSFFSPVDSKRSRLVQSGTGIGSTTLSHCPNDTMDSNTKSVRTNERLSLLSSMNITSSRPPIQDSVRTQQNCCRRRRRQQQNDKLSVKFVDKSQNDVWYYQQHRGSFHNQDVWYTADEFRSMRNDVDDIVRSRMRHVAGQRRCLIRYILELVQPSGGKEQENCNSSAYPSSSCCGRTAVPSSCPPSTTIHNNGGPCSTNHHEQGGPEYLANAYYQCSKYARLDAIARAADLTKEIQNHCRQEEVRRFTVDVIDNVLDNIMMLDTDSFHCPPRPTTRTKTRRTKDTSLLPPRRISSSPRPS